MTYGLIIYDNQGDIQFNTDDPALYFPPSSATSLYGTITPGTVVTSGDRSVKRATSLKAGLESNLILARPRDGSGNTQGMCGVTITGATAPSDQSYFFTNRVYSINGTSFQAASDIEFYFAQNGGDLAQDASPGYGLSVWDSSSNLIFTTSPSSSSNFSRWSAVVAQVVPGDTYNDTNPRGKSIYTTTDNNVWNNLYCVLNGHPMREELDYGKPPSDPSPRNAYLQLKHNSYYFHRDTLNGGGTVYAAEYTFTKTQTAVVPSISTNFTGTITVNSTFSNAYLLVQAFEG